MDSLILICLVVLLSPSIADAQHDRDREPIQTRTKELQELANRLLPAQPRRMRADGVLIDVREALGALASAVSLVHAHRTEARLTALSSRRDSAEGALQRLVHRYRVRGNPAIADQLEAMFAPLWADLDRAEAEPGDLRHLESAAGRIRAALANGDRSHGTTVKSLKLGSER